MYCMYHALSLIDQHIYFTITMDILVYQPLCGIDIMVPSPTI